MLTTSTNTRAASAKEYYTNGQCREDYYTDGLETPGLWFGESCIRLGIAGVVTRETFARLCSNRHPITDEPLTMRSKGNRRVGFDLTFGCPKSVSVLYGLGYEREILEAFHYAVRHTMFEIEQMAHCRVRRGKQSADRMTGNLVWAEFTHFTTRPVDGIPDMHLHAHCFVVNATYDSVENAWKALQPGLIHKRFPYFEAVFHGHLAERLQALGFSVEPKGKFWEVSGVPQSVLDKFSRRTHEIERSVARKGITDPKQKGKEGARTRKAKNKTKYHSGEAMVKEWDARLDAAEREDLNNVKNARTPGVKRASARAIRDAMARAVAKSFERSSVVPEYVLLEDALHLVCGGATVAMLREEMKRQGVISRILEGDTMVTTKAVLEEESRVLQLVREGRGRYSPAKPMNDPNFSKLSEEQKLAANFLLNSRDFVTIMDAAAGTGKTRMMRDLATIISDATGRTVRVFAPTAAAGRGVLREEGFRKADTVAKLLHDKKLQSEVKRGFIWIDEAGLLGTNAMLQVLQLAKSLSCRVFLSGDRQQLGSVSRGDSLRLMREQGGVQSPRMEEIRRQRGEYAEVARQLSRGDAAGAFEKLDRMGVIKESSPAQTHKAAAEDYVKSVNAKQRVLAIAPTHAERHQFTQEVRNCLKENGKLKKKRSYNRLDPLRITAAERQHADAYRRGQIVEFHQNARGGFRAGTRWKIMGRDLFGNVVARRGLVVEALPLKQADRFEVYERKRIEIAVGDTICITRNGRTQSVIDKYLGTIVPPLRQPIRKLNNATRHQVKRFTALGDMVLKNGFIVKRNFGHFDHGYCVTDRLAQGSTVDRVILVQSKMSFTATSQQQFYASATRGAKSIGIYTDDKSGLRAAISRDGARTSATDLIRNGEFQPLDREAAERAGQFEREHRVHGTRKEKERPSPGRDYELERDRL